MPSIALDIPEEVAASLKLPPDMAIAELHKELTLALYQRRILPFSKARILAQLTHWEFEELLGQRHIPRDYDETSLSEDIDYARSGQ